MENHTYLYIRYSSEKQGEGSSRQRQMDYALAYCPDLIQDEKHIYFDGGKSAYKGEQLAAGGALKRFYDDVDNKVVPWGSTLLVEDLDRLSREGMFIASDKLRELLGKGITVVTTRDRKSYEAGVLKFADAITTLVRQEQAHQESAVKSDRVASSYLKRYERARTGEKVKVLLPSWIEWVSTTEYKLKRPEAGIVREIFTMAAKGWSYAMICKDLNQRGILPFRGKAGALWITASVSAIIKGRAAIGEYAPNDGLPPIPDYFPAVVTVEQYEAAQGARAIRKGSGVTSYNEARFNVWGKVGVCALCKRPYHCVEKGRAAVGDREGTYYLVCSGKFGGQCTARNVPAKRSEEVFVDVLMNVVKSDYFVGDQAKELAEIRALAGQVDTLQVQYGRLKRALLVSDDLDEVALAIKTVKADIARLTAEKQGKESKLLERETVERSRASIRAKIDLESRDGRIEANSLLKGLGVVVEIGRGAGSISYTVYQGEQRTKLLTMHDNGERIWDAAYDKDVATRIHELDDTPWPELAINLLSSRTRPEGREPSTEPVPDWTNYDEELPDEAYAMLDITGFGDDPVFHETPLHAPDD
jgi:DNA invertase Pin-like site-specific DNA recombinase